MDTRLGLDVSSAEGFCCLQTWLLCHHLPITVKSLQTRAVSDEKCPREKSWGFTECTCCLVIKSQEGLTRALGTTHPSSSSTAPAGIAGVCRKGCCICWSQQHKTSCAFVRQLNFIPLVLLCKCWPNGSLVPACHYSSPWAFGKERDRGMTCQEKQVPCIFLCPPSVCRSQSGL